MNDLFEIFETENDKIGLHEALGIARVNGLNLVYDPTGIYDASSYYYCLAVLGNMVDNGFLQSFTVVDPENAPPFPESKPEIIY